MPEMLYLQVASGLRGNAATVDVGTTTTLAEGQNATVSNSGDENDATLDFGIPRGAMPAIGFNFNTATTDSDKSAGDCWFNNATPASVTTIYFDNADRDGNTVTSWLDAFDDSTATIKGTLTVTPAASPSGKLIFNVTGPVVDGTGYRKVTVTWVAGTVLPSSGAHLGWSFARSGNNGADGQVAGPGSSVDGEVALFSGSGGATLKRATGSGIPKLTSGVQSIAVAGTDYLAPAAIGSTVQGYDADLATIAGLSPTNNDTLQYISGAWANRTPTQIKTTLSLTVGTDVQAFDARLSSVMPQTSKTASYTLALTDGAGHVYLSGTTAAQTITIPANSSVAFPTGTVVTIVNNSSQSWSIAITTDTLVFAPGGTTGTRTLATKGMCTIIKVTSTGWFISGVGLT